MTMYRVSATFSQRELIDFIDANGTVDLKIEAIQDPDTVSPHGMTRLFDRLFGVGLPPSWSGRSEVPRSSRRSSRR